MSEQPNPIPEAVEPAVNAFGCVVGADLSFAEVVKMQRARDALRVDADMAELEARNAERLIIQKSQKATKAKAS